MGNGNIQPYRKLPVEVEAVCFTGAPQQWETVAKWILDSGGIAYAAKKPWPKKTLAFVVIETFEGKMVARPGDYIVKGVRGEFYPVKPDIFAETYEKVTR